MMANNKASGRRSAASVGQRIEKRVKERRAIGKLYLTDASLRLGHSVDCKF